MCIQPALPQQPSVNNSVTSYAPSQGTASQSLGITSQNQSAVMNKMYCFPRTPEALPGQTNPLNGFQNVIESFKTAVQSTINQIVESFTNSLNNILGNLGFQNPGSQTRPALPRPGNLDIGSVSELPGIGGAADRFEITDLFKDRSEGPIYNYLEPAKGDRKKWYSPLLDSAKDFIKDDAVTFAKEKFSSWFGSKDSKKDAAATKQSNVKTESPSYLSRAYDWVANLF